MTTIINNGNRVSEFTCPIKVRVTKVFQAKYKALQNDPTIHHPINLVFPSIKKMKRGGRRVAKGEEGHRKSRQKGKEGGYQGIEGSGTNEKRGRRTKGGRSTAVILVPKGSKGQHREAFHHAVTPCASINLFHILSNLAV